MDDIILYSPGDERSQCYRCFINLTPRVRVTSTEGEALKYRQEYDLRVIGADRASSFSEEGLEPSFAFSWRRMFLTGYIVCSANWCQFASESLVKVITSETCSKL